MNIDSKIKSFEKRYQVLSRDFQAGKIDETRFIAEVDKLQFQDDWGRYWMVGAQSGTWHYYDGQNWQQADPRDAEKLPFMDDQGRYWQRGVKSGDWYYYQPETGEWVKPGAGDAVAVPSVSGGQQAQAYHSFTPDPSQFQPQGQDAGPGMPNQLDGQLFQDDEGRYWAMGEKTGQWYFYDHTGWHPAHEYRPSTAPYAPQPQSYQPQPGQQPAPGYDSLSQQSVYQQPTQNYPVSPGQSGPPGSGPIPAQNYVVQPQQPTSPTQPIQIYITSPGQDTQPVRGQYVQQEASQPHQPLGHQSAPAGPQQPPPAYTTNSQPPAFQQPAQTHSQAQDAPPAETQVNVPVKLGDADPSPSRPSDRSESGSWYYFDGQQWLKYSSGEPDDSPPSLPKMVIDQEAKPTQAKTEPKSEPVVAEFIEDDEPPVEVVDVEVITVIDPEPESKPEPKQAATAPPPEPLPAPEPVPQSLADEVPPRRASRPGEVSGRREAPGQLQPQPRQRSTSEPSRTGVPRKREAAHEPTIIIPTGAAVSNIAARESSTGRGSRPVRPAPNQRRRARENTLPMEPMRRAEPAAPGEVHRTVTQAMPTVTAARARADTAPVKPPPPAKQTAQQKAAASAPVSKATDAEPEKEGYTLGDVLRSLPSTIWTFVGGVLILLVCAVGLIFSWSWFQGDESSMGGLVAVPSLTPTLDAGPPDATPTPGPTVVPVAETDVASTPAALIAFSSSDLGYTVEYPENWEQKEEELCGVFSPSSNGLDIDDPKDSVMLICKSADSDAAISDLLTEVLASFPAEAETLNEGTISIASEIWTSAQIRFEDEDLGGQGIATLAVTNKDGNGYYLVAIAPSEEWNAVQPQFQAMINSFSFGTATIAQAGTPEAKETEAEAEDEQKSATTTSPTRQTETEAEATPKATPTPKGTATPLVYAVQSGDTLLEIALRFGVDVELLASKNDIDDPGSLQLGQELIIPFTAEELEAFNTETDSVAVADTDTAETETTADAEAPAGDEQDTQTPEASVPTEAPAEDAASAGGVPASVSGRIVYAAFNPGTNVYDIWMADVATGEQTMIATEASQPAFNKDGSLLAYRSWNLGNRGVFFRDFVGGREGLVTRFVEDGLPTWAADGYSFAFASRREGDRVPRIFVGNQSGDGDYGIGFQGEYPATFPDGRLVVKGCSPSGDCGLYVMGASGGGETKISSERSDTAPAVSPDGGKIAVMSSGRGATNWEIWVMNADGSNPQRLTNNGSNEGLPAWSPDGQSIAYVSDQGGVWAVWVMNVDGSNQRKLFNMQGSPDGIVLRDKDNSKGWLEERISWAP